MKGNKICYKLVVENSLKAFMVDYKPTNTTMTHLHTDSITNYIECTSNIQCWENT